MSERKGRVAFYIEKPFHEAMLLPIYECAESEFACLVSDNIREIIDFRPEALFISDKCDKVLRRYLPETLIIWTRHGFSTKNWSHVCLERCDIACLSSEWFRDFFIQKGHLPQIDFWITGFPPMDRVFRNITSTVSGKRGTTVLYAPTFDAHLAAEPVLGEFWIKKVLHHFPDIDILIKPHPHIRTFHPLWISSWEKEVQRDPRVRLLGSDDDFYNVMTEGDVLVTDASSVMFPFLVLDRPVILVNNPERFGDPRYAPEGPEWISRSLGSEIESADGLIRALELNFSQPLLKSRERQFFRDRYMGRSFDGCVSERIVSHLKELLLPSRDQSSWTRKLWRKKRIRGHLHSLVLRCEPRYNIRNRSGRKE